MDKSIMAGSMMIFKITYGRIISLAAELGQFGLLRQLGWTSTPPTPD